MNNVDRVSVRVPFTGWLVTASFFFFDAAFAWWVITGSEMSFRAVISGSVIVVTSFILVTVVALTTLARASNERI